MAAPRDVGEAVGAKVAPPTAVGEGVGAKEKVVGAEVKGAGVGLCVFWLGRRNR